MHFFERAAGVWGPPRSIESPQPGTYFGLAVAIDGDTAVVGASMDDDVQQAGGAVHVYHRVGGDWVEQAKLIPDGVQFAERFGFSAAVSGQNVVAGAWGRTHMEVDLAGAAYAFSRVDGQWQRSKDLPPSLRSDDDRLGFSVAASGSLAVAGAPYYSSVKGTAFVFEAQ